ncbi:MAG TPA: sugar ABC transporter substrate-binding protein [Burkholderiaceae bacterium]|nr:sugar ABC transporter substrate-binding protein [Burkholderiaceae bacterium]
MLPLQSPAATNPRRRALLRAAAYAVAPAVAAGCTRARDDTVRFWAMGREGEVLGELLREFERSAGFRVHVEQLPWSAGHEKLLTAFAGETTPDLCQLGNTWLPELVALGALEPLGARVRASPVIDPRDYFDGIWETNTSTGEPYGVPWYVDTRLLFYRADLLAQAGFPAPPRRWDEWVQMLEALKRTMGRDRYAILLPLNEFEPLVALSLQQDEPLLRDGDRWGNFRSAGFGRTLRFYLSMFERGFAPAGSDNQIANVWNEFGRGTFAFYISGPWNIGEFKRRLPAELQSVWMTAPLPGPGGPGASLAGGSSLVMFRRSRRKEAAWRVVEYLAQPAVQRRLHTMTGNLPPRRSTWDDPVLATDPYARAFFEQLGRVRPAPKVPEWERIATEVRLAVERVVHGELDASDAPAELDARTDRILEKRRWMLARAQAKTA